MRKRKIAKTVTFDRFAAIDFETADYGRDSACAVSVVVAEQGCRQERFSRKSRYKGSGFSMMDEKGKTKPSNRC